LGEFLQAIVKLIEGGGGQPGGLLVGGVFEQKLLDPTDGQTLGQVIKGAMLLALAAGAVGFATGGEALNDAGADEVGRQAGLIEQTLTALAQRQCGEAAEAEYLCHRYGQDSQAGGQSKEKESAR
jgi:hypothetical protein